MPNSSKNLNIKIADNPETAKNFTGVNVIVDFFRFSTTVSVLVNRGVDVKIFSDEKLAVSYYIKNNDYDFFSEKDINNVNRYDNSPYLASISNSEKAVIVTNSGSKAVMASENACKIIIASLCNINAVKKYIKNCNKDVLLVPACVFFDTSHVEDFIACKYYSEYFLDKADNIDAEELKNEISKTGRIKELIQKREIAEKDLEIIFSRDIFSIYPSVIIEGVYGKAKAEKSNS